MNNIIHYQKRAMIVKMVGKIRKFLGKREFRENSKKNEFLDENLRKKEKEKLY